MATPIRVAVLWHDTVTQELLARRAVHVGTDLRCDLVLPAVADLGARHPLLTPDGEGGWLLRPTAGMSGTIERAGTREDLDAVRPTSLSNGDWGQIDLGTIGLFFRIGEEPARLPTGTLLGAVEAPMLGSLLGALTAHLALLIGAFLLFDERPRLQTMPEDLREVVFTTQAPAKEIEHEMEVESLTEEVAKRAPEKETAFGDAKETKQPKLPSNDTPLVNGIRQKALFKSLGQGAISNIMGRPDSLANKLDVALTGTGDEAPIIAGADGYGLRGVGEPGGGGQGPGGVVGGTGLGLETGRGISTRSRLKKRTRRRPTVRPQPPTIAGGAFCKPKDIQRVVNLRARGVKYCYEKELKTHPELSGKLMMSWGIGMDGRVVKVRVEGNTLGSKTVAGCVQRAIKRWRFPKPDGGMCQVRYPFIFSNGL